MPFKSGYTRKISFIAVMTSLCVSSNYLLVGLPNIKLMDLLVFVSGYLMGSLSGASVGMLTWVIYGTLNPYGFNLPTLFATSIGESFYGILGGMYGRTAFESSERWDHKISSRGYWEPNVKIGILGFVITFTYDMFTNIVTSLVFEIPVVLYIMTGIPFTAVHEASNFLFFFFVSNTLIGAIQRIFPFKEVRNNSAEE